jgi:hypothetical protein
LTRLSGFRAKRTAGEKGAQNSFSKKYLKIYELLTVLLTDVPLLRFLTIFVYFVVERKSGSLNAT